MTEFVNKNDRQLYFNQVKGTIAQLNDGEKFCSLTLDVGHENPRKVNLVMKKHYFDEISKAYSIGQKVIIRYYLSSKEKNGRWYTMANILDVLSDQYNQ
jgi:hypothetical protein